MLNHIPKKKLLLLFGDILLVYGAYLLSPIVYFRVLVFDPFQSLHEVILVIFIYVSCFYIGDLYSFESKFTTTGYIYRFFAGTTVATGVTLVIFSFFPRIELTRGIFIVNSVLTFILTFLWRLTFEIVFRKYISKQKNILIVGAGRTGESIYKIIKNDPSCRIAGFIDDDPDRHGRHKLPNLLGDYAMIEQIVQNEHIDNIIIAIKNIKNNILLRSILKCKINGINVYDMPSYCEEMLGKIQVEWLDDLWFLNMPLYGVKRNVYNRRIKRIISIILSSGFLAISLPLLLITMIAIKLDSKGPIFFRQKRVGLNRILFEVIKFRTMKIGTDSNREFAGKKDDPRITRIGRILRLSRVDEIPQMWNVLKGEMNVIGPRALMLEEVEQFEAKVPYFSLRHSVKPGITGWAQVNYQHGVSVEDALQKLKYDLFYIKNLSPFLDFHILLRTVRVVMFGKGAR